MTTFISDDFLLYTETSKRLYHEFAKDLPIIDYHTHLPPDQLADDKQFADLTEIWLNGDHYKWRAMRANGIAEKYITGDVSNWDKFYQWAITVPNTVRNPLFHWTHLELNRYFGIKDFLDPESARSIYNVAGEQLVSPEFSVRQIPIRMNVEVICSTDDPTDQLHYHQKLKEDHYQVKVLPTFRPDNVLKIEDPDFFRNYISLLGEVGGVVIKTLDDLLQVLQERVTYFDKKGCKLSDHGLNQMPSRDYDYKMVKETFENAMSGKNIELFAVEQYQSLLLHELCKMYHAKGWIQQFHLGALRNTNPRLLGELGADAGVDSIGDFSHADSMARFFARLENEDALAKTILYNVNPSDNEVFATMAGNFQDGSVPGKIQFGSAWWFMDQKDGIEKQINALSNMGLISQFIGMLTDSRSFLSFPRHEYFRRIICNIFGEEIERGELPGDISWIGGIIRNICYNNAKDYFEF